MKTENTEASYAKIQTILLAVVLAVLLIGVILLAVQVTKLNKGMKLIEQEIQEINIDEVNNAVVSLKEAANTLKEVDIGALNSLVQSLESVSTKLQNAVNAITGIFGR